MMRKKLDLTKTVTFSGHLFTTTLHSAGWGAEECAPRILYQKGLDILINERELEQRPYNFHIKPHLTNEKKKKKTRKKKKKKKKKKEKKEKKKKRWTIYCPLAQCILPRFQVVPANWDYL